jgi:hypothetical protein
VRAGVNPANVRQAVRSIVAEMERIRQEPISAAELAAGQRFLTDQDARPAIRTTPGDTRHTAPLVAQPACAGVRST